MTFIPFATQNRHSGTAEYSGERPINVFARPADGVTPVALIGRGGLDPAADVGGAVRATITHNGVQHSVANGRLSKVVGSVVTDLGAITDSDYTTMASNGTEIAIVAGDTYHLYSGGTVAVVETGSIVTPKGVVFADGFFVVWGNAESRDGGATISGLNDGATFLGLDLFFAENNPDGIVGMVWDHGELLAFGTETVQSFFNSGNADQPFQPNQARILEHGCLDPSTLQKDDSAVFWVSDDKRICLTRGAGREVISTREIEEHIADKTIQGSLVYSDRGAQFYALRIKDNPTLCYDITTKLWCEAATGVDHGPWIATTACTVDGLQYFGTSTGKICTIGSGVFTDDGLVMVADVTSAPLVQKGKLFTISQLHLSMRTGSVDIGRDAKVVLNMKRNGTWGPEKTRSMGRIGDREKLIRWNGLGQFRRAQCRFRISDEVSRDMYGINYE